jgi:hypothetical protein
MNENSLERRKAVQALQQITEEWREAVNGASLVDVRGSVGLLLLDVATGLGLDNKEQAEALGIELVE